MVTDHLREDSQQQALEILERPSGQRKKQTQNSRRTLKRQLNDVIMGRRAMLKVYSNALNSDCWFINEGLINPEKETFPGKVITMGMLAELMTDEQSFAQVLHNIINGTQQ